MRLRALVGLAVGGLLVAACTSGGAAQPPTSVGRTPATGMVQGGSATQGTKRVWSSLPWHLVDVNGRTVTIDPLRGVCQTLDGSKVRETATSVTIGALAVSSHALCVSMAVGGRHVDVVLKQPLGSRTLIHAPSGVVYRENSTA